MKMRLVGVFSLIAFIWLALQYWPVTIHIQDATLEENFTIRMPIKDKNILDYFFRDVCFLNAWAYTLIGSKPVSIHHYTKPLAAFRNGLKHLKADLFFPPNLPAICYLLNPEQIKIKMGCDALARYIDSLPSTRFSFFTHHSDEETVYFALVDKVKLIEIVKQHLDDFDPVLHSMSIETEDLYDNEVLCNFFKNLKSNRLYGTVFGFGRENSRLFEMYLSMDLQQNPMASMWPQEDEAWLEGINEKNVSFQSWVPSDIFYPCFACDPNSPETKQLKQIYRAEREKILTYYEGKDVVEATLSLLNQK